MTRGRKVWSEIVPASGQKVAGAVFALSAQGSVDRVQCTVQCTYDIVQWTVYATLQTTVYMIQSISQGTMYSTVQSTLYTVQSM